MLPSIARISSALPARLVRHVSAAARHGLALYVPWPYCKQICVYCDFNKYVERNIDHDRITACYKASLERHMAALPHTSIASIYFGGGTPSLALPETIASIITTAANIIPLQPNAEVWPIWTRTDQLGYHTACTVLDNTGGQSNIGVAE